MLMVAASYIFSAGQSVPKTANFGLFAIKQHTDDQGRI